MFVASGDAVARTRRVGADTIQDNVRDHQLKVIKHNHLIANLLCFLRAATRGGSGNH